MTREEKAIHVTKITQKLQNKPNVYIADTGGMSVAEVNTLRRACFKSSVEMVVVKNTLLRKAMEASGKDYSEIFPALKMQSAVFFANENFKEPAIIIKGFRKGKLKPALKGAFIDQSVFLGDDSLDALISLKSKNELIADVIAMLQGPIRNVISGLSAASGQKIAGLLKTLEDRGDK